MASPLMIANKKSYNGLRDHFNGDAEVNDDDLQMDEISAVLALALSGDNPVKEEIETFPETEGGMAEPVDAPEKHDQDQPSATAKPNSRTLTRRDPLLLYFL